MKNLSKALFASAIKVSIGKQMVIPVSANEDSLADNNSINQKELENKTTFNREKEKDSYTYILHRGSFLLWSDDIVCLDTSVNQGTTYAENKDVAPCNPTPWGVLGPYGETRTDHLRVHGNSKVAWW